MASSSPDPSANGGQLRAAARAPDRTTRNLLWLIDLARQEAGPPLRLHASVVEPGSAFGAPAFSHEFLEWLCARDEQRWPLRAAIARLHGAGVRQGLPRIDTTAAAIATTRDLTLAGEVLARAPGHAKGPCPDRPALCTHRRYPEMGNRAVALAHCADALGRVRREFENPYRRRLAST